MLDTNPVTTAIAAMIVAGTPHQQLLTAVTTFPNLTWRELSQAIQCATAAAEKRGARKH